MNKRKAAEFVQPMLFEPPAPAASGWQPHALSAATQVHWAMPVEIDGRLDATHYVITQRPERSLHHLGCPLLPLQQWVTVNPQVRRLPVERGYLLYEQCLYAEIRSVSEGCWLLGFELPVTAVRDLPSRAAYEPKPGDLLLPRVYSALHKAVMVVETPLPLVASDAFALLHPPSHEQGLVLLALLHHQVLGEQLWALTSGTMIRTVTVDKLDDLQVPLLPAGAQQQVVALVSDLIEAQASATFPDSNLDLVRYWQNCSISQWQRHAAHLTQQLYTLIDQALARG